MDPVYPQRPASRPSNLTAVTGYLDAVHRKGEVDAAYAALPQCDLSVRLRSLLSALLLGDAAPDAWRREVSRGLFVGERGYIRPIV
jgi:hypothetical protein